MDSPAFFVQAEHIAERTQEERRKNAGRTVARTWERHNTAKRTKRTKRMNEGIKNRIKLVSSFLMCVLSLSAAITLSFAWFAKNDTVNGGGMSVAIENDANVVGRSILLRTKATPTAVPRTEIQKNHRRSRANGRV
ncbi:MAG: hypothetical protein SOT09_02105 [Candidatus Borkfalkiaceae bacterium]|nr:hypothetical protein [Christensenellaceae bacterium]